MGIKGKGALAEIIMITGLLALGALLAGIIVPTLFGTFSISGWVSGFITAIIQALIVVFALAFAKIGIVQIIIGGVIIFVGGIVGGFICGYIGVSTQIQTLLILVIQAALLVAMGFSGKGKSALPKIKA
jgi:hypothetical protein